MTATFTERYVAETVRHLPAAVADDVRAELTGSIVEAVESRIEQGERPYDAERAVLTELGDPAALAASYTDRPLQLIGPRHYLAWRRSLKVLLLVVPLLAGLVVAVVRVGQQRTMVEVIGHGILTGLFAVVHVCFWATLLFVVLDRIGRRGAAWQVEKLPQLARQYSASTEIISALVGPMVLMVLFALSVLGLSPLFNQRLWPWWFLLLFAITAAEVIVNVMRIRHGRWTSRLAVANAVVMVLFASWFLILLWRGELVSEQWMAALQGSADLGRGLAIVFGVAVVVGVVWNIAYAWRKVRRAG